MKKYNDMKRKVFIAVMSLVVSGGLSGQSVYPGQHSGKLKKETIAPMQVKSFDLKDVRLLDSPFKNAMDRNAAWMLEMDMDRLLSNFLKNAGLEPKGESYGSWESMGIAGHTLGHYLSAVAQHP